LLLIPAGMERLPPTPPRDRHQNLQLRRGATLRRRRLPRCAAISALAVVLGASAQAQAQSAETPLPSVDVAASAAPIRSVTSAALAASATPAAATALATPLMPVVPGAPPSPHARPATVPLVIEGPTHGMLHILVDVPLSDSPLAASVRQEACTTPCALDVSPGPYRFYIAEGTRHGLGRPIALRTTVPDGGALVRVRGQNTGLWVVGLEGAAWGSAAVTAVPVVLALHPFGAQQLGTGDWIFATSLTVGGLALSALGVWGMVQSSARVTSSGPLPIERAAATQPLITVAPITQGALVLAGARF
jgi:hypothetical protein